MRIFKQLSIAAILLQVIAATAGPAEDRQTLLDACSATKNSDERGRCFEALARMSVADTAARTASVRGPYDDFVKAAKDAISADLKDPSSTVYRDLFISGSGPNQALCGELNAKNSYGGYVGFLRFYSTTRPTFQAIETPGKRHWMDEAWSNFCRQKVADIE